MNSLLKYDAKIYKTHPLSAIVKIESVTDRIGNLFYCVSLCSKCADDYDTHYMFSKLSSAIDFVSSNFK